MSRSKLKLVLRSILTLSAVSLVGCGKFTFSGVGGSGQSVPPCSTAVHFSWTAPTTNTDGTPLTNLAGYNIYYGTTSKTYVGKINVPDNTATTYSTTTLLPNTYYFAMTAYNTNNGESPYSNEVKYTLQQCMTAEINLRTGAVRTSYTGPRYP